MRFGRAMRWVAVIVLVVLMGAAWQVGLQRSSLPTRADVQAPYGAIEPAGPDEDGRPSAAIAHAHSQAEQRAEARDLQRARRDALRERILERERTRPGLADGPSRDRADADAADEPPPGPGLIDRTDRRLGSLIEALNGDFLPLAHECIDEATERNPELRGMLQLNLQLVADAELGAVIESATFPANNPIQDLDLLDCVRETALSTSLPPPPEGGREHVMLTMPIGAEAEPDAKG